MNQAFVMDRVIVRGAGEVASGVIRRLSMAGFEVMALERPEPTCIRKQVCFAEAYYRGEVSVEGVSSVVVKSVDEAIAAAGSRRVPILVDPEATHVPALAPMAVVDGRMLKRAVAVDLEMTPIVVGLGPGFVVGENCQAVVETERGIDLGRVLYRGSARSYSGMPGAVQGVRRKRVLRSPADGKFTALADIAEKVSSGQVVGEVAGEAVVTEIDGIVRGMLHDGLTVSAGQKIGDIDPRGDKELCYKMSDKANAVGGGALEAVMALKISMGNELSHHK